MLLSADAMGGRHCDPIGALAILLLKAQQSQPFHLSARCARAGDFNMLASCYRESLRFSQDRLSPLLVSLDRVPSDEYEHQLEWVGRIFSLVFEAFNQGESRSSSFFCEAS